MLKSVVYTACAGSLLCLAYGAIGPPSESAPRRVRITNEMQEPIVELHAATLGSGDWQADLLGPWDSLRPGNSVWVDIDDRNESCRIDLKMVLDDGTERVSRSVDVCRGEGWAAVLR
jgi:hypothetical protein